MFRILSLAVAFLFISPSPKAWAWGETGHDIVARVATRLLLNKVEKKEQPMLVTPFLKREHMLAHLANVPDIVWRAEYQSKEDLAANAKTHYINLEKLLRNGKPCFSLARPASEAKLLLTQGSLADEVGTGPWRLNQLYRELVKALSKVNALPLKSREAAKQIDEALLYAGLLAHLVGDLAQPMHTITDYDGWNRGQGGLHEYFESTMVDAYDLDLITNVYKQATKSGPYRQKLQPAVTQKMPGVETDNTLKIAFALTCNSFDAAKGLFALDLKQSLVKKSTTDHSKPAERKPAKEVRAQFESLIVDRLSLGADVLATLWFNAWQESGRPDMAAYQSYAYPVAPKFIPTDY